MWTGRLKAQKMEILKVCGSATQVYSGRRVIKYRPDPEFGSDCSDAPDYHLGI